MEKEAVKVGVRRTFWLPKHLDEKAEEVRKALGLSKSGFYRFCILEALKNVIILQERREGKGDG
ncbi:MAG: hypothetical protein QXT28_06975 [Thermofilaceae archaeon]